jgi:fermentation-respiration switch protein FrsA (DUF1100 family)
MKKWLKRFTWFIAALLIIEFSVGEYFYRKISQNNPNKGISLLENQIKNGALDAVWYNSLKKEIIRVESADHYSLETLILLHPDTTDHTIIVHHGLGADKFVMLKVAPMYMDLGFNVVLHDSRGHGLSGGKNHTYGYYEQDDLQAIVEEIKNRFPNGRLAIHGESMGAATSMMHAIKYQERNAVDFYIEDCGYSDLKTLFKYRLKNDFGLPNLLILEFSSLVTWLHDGYFFKDVSPIKGMESLATPMLFIHGANDDYVPVFMATDLFEKKNKDKTLHLVENAAHAVSFNVNPQGYEENVSHFIQKAESGKIE